MRLLQRLCKNNIHLNSISKPEHQELVPIFSSQVLQRYDNLQYKGLQMVSEADRPAIGKPEKGLTGIASSYKKDTKTDGTPELF